MTELRRTHESTEGKWHSETADLQQQVVLLTQELHHLKENECDAGEMVDALKKANARITSERDEVLDKQKTLLDSVEQFDSHLSTLRSELNLRNRSVEDLKAVVVDYEGKAQGLLQEVQSLTESNAESTRQIETQARVLEAKESRLVSLRDELSKNKQAAVDRVLELEDQKKQHQSMIRDLEQKLEEAKGYIRLVKGSYDRLADNPADLVSHLEPVRRGIARKRCSRHRLTEVASTPASRSASVSSSRSVSLEPCQDELSRVVQAVESFPGLLESKMKVVPESFQPNLVLKDDEPEQWLEPLSVPVQFTKRTRSKSLVGDTPRFGY
ncbi:MAG: hypothetical protein KVP17_002279 [Porospora cf. gigantea B]|nr:MAG: hypothetical protein KVP17_002279 [Porospora cf. gigantea B]